MMLYPLGVSSELTMAWLALKLSQLFIHILTHCFVPPKPCELTGKTLHRYTGFMVLYPLGVSSELTMAWLALKLSQLFKSMHWHIASYPLTL
jgi:hypothetical protein